MIKKQKKQLSNQFLFASLLFFPCLIFFFFYALKFNEKFFSFIALACLIIAVFNFIFLRSANLREELILLQKEDYQERTNLLANKMNNENLAVGYLRQKILNYGSLKSVTEKLSKCLSLYDTAHVLSTETCALLGEEDKVCILYLFEPESSELGIIATNKGKATEVIKAKKGDIFDSWVIKKLQPLIVEDTKKDFRFDLEKADSDATRKIRSLISAALVIGRRVLGILRVDSFKENSFISDDLRLLTAMSDIGAMALENALLFERAEELAIRDGLTGLYLRRYLWERISEETLRALRKNYPLSLLMIDIDHFKSYNDKFGHVAGDIVLKTMSKVLTENLVSAGNIVSRYGGEEFAILLPNCSKQDAFILAEKLRKKIKEEKIILRKKPSQITVSIGVSGFPTDAKTRDDLILKADNALYQAKQLGRDKVCCI